MSAAPTMAPSLPVGQAAEHLKVKLRPDLIVQPQFYEGMTHYVIKDPIALKYFRFKIEEYFLLQQFDGKQTLQDVKRAFERKYRPQTITVDDLLRFASQLHEAGIAQVDSPDQATALIRRRKKNQWKKVWQFLANILYIKIPVVDPEKMLTGMYPYFRWIYTSWFVAFSVGMMLAALTLVASQWTTFSSRLPDFQSFFNWRTIIYFWCSLAIVKIIHEFGHGLTAKHFGGEVHEMGMLFLVLTPALYCDVTDSLAPAQQVEADLDLGGRDLRRAASWPAWPRSSGGTPSRGCFNSLCLATMFICSVNTVLFNANPLLRYDGYYVTSDFLEIPNLRIKSTQFFAYLFQEKVLGLEVPVQSYMPRSRRTLFVTYAIASYVYRWVVTFSILFFLSQFLKPYKLETVSYAIALGSLIPMVGMPAYQIVKFVRQPGRMRKVKKVRAGVFAACFATAVTGILLIPTPLRVSGTLVLQPASPTEIYAEVPGRLVSLDVVDGDMVKEGDLLARLSSPEKQLEVRQLQEQIDVNHIKWLVNGNVSDPSNRAMALQSLKAKEDLEPALARVTEQVGKLTLIAPRDGQVMGVPHKEVEGQYLKPGKPIFEIADPRKLEAHIILDQTDIDLVHADGPNKPTAWVKIYGTSEKTFKSYVSQVARRNQEEIPTELSNNAGGEIATKQDEKTGVAKPITAVYEVIIPVDNPDLLLQPKLRGFAKIDGGHSTLAWWLWRLITKTFHFTL